ncbi:hypothetical protein NLJ89_g7710 [Agrocybe chaxingu]|uniref:Uncharacterized protein n=1 Tax=Agrocybe chaxingu TaxID=84603 RepID=A0A9W8JWM6_9AGAR|nr:hypothetical protein NLJ89_g7710 [Agrocybe chaxingu]
MMLGPFQLLRRIDSDFVNLSPIVAYSGTAPVMNRDVGSGDSTSGSATTASPCASSNSVTSPSANASSSWNTSVIANATVITKGSPEVCGTWVPLVVAQAYVREHLSGEGAHALEVFLSDTLVDRFPRALRDLQFQLTHQSAKGLNQFGRHFASTLLAGGLGVETSIKILHHPPHHHHQHGQHTSSAMLPGMNTLVMPTPSFVLGLGRADENEVPLSATEQELFHELCVIPPDWEKESGCVGDDERENDEEIQDGEAMDVDVDAQKTATFTPDTYNSSAFVDIDRHPGFEFRFEAHTLARVVHILYVIALLVRVRLAVVYIQRCKLKLNACHLCRGVMRVALDED